MTALLNPEQQQAVHHVHSPCLVLAGAGSGKTRVITHKIAHLIRTGTPAKHIAAITFTNKAAAEMRERIKKLIGKDAKGLVVCTFHALGVRMLREDGAALGLKPQFSILDASDVLSLLKDCGSTTDASLAKKWQWQISLWKNQGLSAEEALAQAGSFAEQRTCAQIMQRYEERLQAYQSVDFDDLIGLQLKLLTQHADVRTKWQNTFSHILVDEYQDTNATQYAVLKQLVGYPNAADARFTAVGDDDQSIYGWRGATLENLKQLPIDFPQLQVIKLEQNYRSSSAILQAANNIISTNPKLFPKKLWSALGNGEPVRIIDCDNEEHEAERTVARIQSLLAAGCQHKDIAVLYRANHQSRALEGALRKVQLPYKVSGGISFFDRSEIKDLCAWFRLLANSADDPAFLRAITSPKRGIGHTTLHKLGTFANTYKSNLFETLFNPNMASIFATRTADNLKDFGNYINDLEYQANTLSGKEAAHEFLLQWLQDIGFEQYIYDTEKSAQKAAARWNNVLDFCDWVATRCGGELDPTMETHTMSERKTVLEVVQNIALISTISEREADQNSITLSTLHAAKGLEWQHVVLIGVVEGVLPFKRPEEQAHKPLTPADADKAALHLQEERRLMYVGITRAQRTLAISWSRKRKKGREYINCSPSRFIQEMQLDQATVKEDPREKLKALRAEFAKKAAQHKG